MESSDQQRQMLIHRGGINLSDRPMCFQVMKQKRPTPIYTKPVTLKSCLRTVTYENF
jgi:hypothetical protein